MTRINTAQSLQYRSSQAFMHTGNGFQMLDRPLAGVIPPLVTPLLGRNLLDEPGLARLIEHVLGGGVHGLFLLGTTGEAASLTPALRRQVVTQAIQQVDRRVPVLVGVTDNAVAEAIEMAHFASAAGADAIVVSSPCYVPLEQRELAEYVCTIAAEVRLPIFLYNMPRLTKTAFSVETVRLLMQAEQVVGIKDSSGDLDYLKSICFVAQTRPEWTVLVGADEALTEALALGAHGCVGGGANVWPNLLVDLYHASVNDETRRAEELKQRLDKLHAILNCGLYVASSIRGLKTALALLGICSGQMAEPFAQCSKTEIDHIQRVLERTGLLRRVSGANSHVPCSRVELKGPAEQHEAETANKKRV